jgi:hypothetical protein
MKIEISAQIFEKKTPQIPSLMKILPLGVELFHADRHNEPNSRFSQFYQ